MRITIVGYGTWGDVLPSLALGLGLKEAGHRVRLMVTQDFVPWARGRGLEITSLPVDKRLTMRSVSSWTDPLRVLRGMQRAVGPGLKAAGISLVEQAKDTDALIANEWLLATADGAAQAFGLRLIHMSMQPTVQTSMRPVATVPPLPRWLPLRGLYNRWSYPFAHFLRWLMYARAQNDIRRQVLGIPALSPIGFEDLFRRIPSINMVSRHLLPHPPDWAAHHHTTGFAFYRDPEWKPSPALAAFLGEGPKPIYIGFGSMHDRSPAKTTELILTVLAHCHQRAVIHRGWAGLGEIDLPTGVFVVDHIPHTWLFPQMAAVVHHAGAGTTAAALRAGVPSVPVPHSGDQAFWARRLHDIGAATKPLARGKLSAAALAARITQATSDSALRSNADALGSLIEAEDGITRAVGAIENSLG